MNKSFKVFSMIATAIIAFTFNACNNDLEFVEEDLSNEATFSATRAGADHQVFGLYESEFIAGQHEVAGKISICNDYENVYVTFTTENGWQIRRTHLFIGPKEILLDPANGYVNKNGSPKNGQFPYGDYFDPYVTEWVFSLPLTELYAMFGLEFDMEVDVCPIIAAHAEVLKQKSDGTWQEETAWGKGKKFVKKGNWSMYIEGYCTEFPPEDPPTPPTEYTLDKETAWAFDGYNHEYNPGQGGNWAFYIDYADVEKTCVLYAGQKETDMTVTLTPAGEGKVKMVFENIFEIAPENDGKWVLQEYNDEGEWIDDAVKVQGYETAPSGNPSPGQFTYYKGRELEIVVDAANFYGIHLDVAKLTVNK
ncbi:MAG: hypothetical protein Q4D30_11390 [Bacteroidales bacterium]|nr:hypothetical protein [Bacteroidales bacterium]